MDFVVEMLVFVGMFRCYLLLVVLKFTHNFLFRPLKHFQTIDISTHPFNFVLDSFFDETNAFENIGYIVDSAFLNSELDSCVVQVNYMIFGFSDQDDKVLRKFSETVF